MFIFDVINRVFISGGPCMYNLEPDDHLQPKCAHMAREGDISTGPLKVRGHGGQLEGPGGSPRQLRRCHLPVFGVSGILRILGASGYRLGIHGGKQVSALASPSEPGRPKEKGMQFGAK